MPCHEDEIVVPVEFNHFYEIAAAAPERAQVMLEKAAFDVEAEAKVNAPKWLGMLAGGIQQGPGEGVFQRRVNVASDYGPAVEYGARAHWLPTAAITGELAAWAAAHGAPGAEWAIAAKIAREGTPAQPFLTPAVETVRAAMPFSMQGIVGIG